MIESLLKKFGYYKVVTADEHTEADLELLLLESYGDIFDDEVERAEEEVILKQVGDVEGFVQYMRKMANNDMRRYFAAVTDKDRDVIRGAFARTVYLKNRAVGKVA